MHRLRISLLLVVAVVGSSLACTRLAMQTIRGMARTAETLAKLDPTAVARCGA